MTRRILHIEIPVDTGQDIDPRLAENIKHKMVDWSDGRYPFATEMLVHGIETIIRDALRSLVEQDKHREFGNAMVEHEDGRGTSAKWWLESQKVTIPHPCLRVSEVVVTLKPDTNNSLEIDQS